ncbi:hypothetical protein A2U01_0048174, partial [Trifolium medium]|nr:hypothetical protein [Trifolium medium]
VLHHNIVRAAPLPVVHIAHPPVAQAAPPPAAQAALPPDVAVLRNLHILTV